MQLLVTVFIICQPTITLADNLSLDDVRQILRQAREHVVSTPDAHHASRHLQFIADAQAKAGDVDEAIQTAVAIDRLPKGRFGSLFTKESALWAVHRARVDVGDIHGATKVQSFFSVEEAAESKALLLALLAEEKATTKDYDGAKLIVESIVDAEQRARGMARIAHGQAIAGDVQGALHTARSITDKASRSESLGNVAVAQARGGDFTGGIKTARSIVEEEKQINAYWDIALIQAEKGAVEDAMVTVEKIASEWAYDDASLDVANIQATRGEMQPALKLAHRISARWKRAIGIQEIARVQALAGNRVGARKSLRIAYRTAQEEKNRWLRVRALIRCAGTSVLVGNEEEALKVASSLPNDEEAHEAPMRHQALMAIVEALGTMGNIAAALKVENLVLDQVRELPMAQRYSEVDVRKSIKLEMYPAMIRAYSKAGNGTAALAWAFELTDSELKGGVLLAIAEGALDVLLPPAVPMKKQRFRFPL